MGRSAGRSNRGASESPASGSAAERHQGAGACLVLLLAAAPLAGAVQPGPTGVVEEQRVTAVDLLVALERATGPRQDVTPPAGLRLDEFTLLRDGRPIPLLAMARPGHEELEPWRIVIYVDRALSSRHSVRWAAGELAERARRLAEMGEVEIVVADPDPRRILAPSRDAALIDQTLSGLFLAPEAGDLVVALREEFLIRLTDKTAAGSVLLDLGQLVREEEELLALQQDRLLSWILDREPATARKAVFLVNDGFDLRPSDFYSAYLEERGGPDGPASAVELTGMVRSSARTLAAYGWIVAPLTPPQPPAGARKFGVGLLPPNAPGIFAVVSLRSVAAWLDRNRRPKRAHAYYELGRSLREAGELERAVDAFRKAVYHYYDHPKSAGRQAAALVAWGETVELQGKAVAAREIFRRAIAFDPTLAARYPFAAARLASPREPLALLAESSAGRLVADARGLEAMLSSLAGRLRLTYQLAGPVPGSLHAVELRLARRRFELCYPTWGRWGTPAAAAELRLRRLLAGELDAGNLELTTDFGPGDLLRIRVDRADSPEEVRPLRFRISWAAAGNGTVSRLHHRPWRAEVAAGGEAVTSLPLSLRPGESLIAIVVEDLDSAAWGGTVVETEPGAPNGRSPFAAPRPARRGPAKLPPG